WGKETGMNAIGHSDRPCSARTVPLPALHLTRFPGEFGPILHCYGELSVATVEALRRELALLEPLGHRVLTLNLTGCGFLDVDGLLAVLDSFKRQQAGQCHLVVVAGAGQPGQLLRITGMDRIIPVFPSEPLAMCALHGGGPALPGPASWAADRTESVTRWSA